MRLIRLLVVGALLHPTASHALDILTCTGANIVPHGETATLVADVDCTPAPGEPVPGYGVHLEAGATLLLGGHTLRGAVWNVYCPRSCRIVGPGALAGATGMAIYSGGRGRSSVSDVLVHDNFGAIDLVEQRVTLTNVTVMNSTLYGIRVGKLVASNLTVSGTGGDGILTDRGIKGSDVAVTGNHTGIGGRGFVRLTGLTATGNISGLFALRRVRLEDSVVSGNAGDDLLTRRRPVLLNTACETSAMLLGTGPYTIGPPWGVCAGD